MTNEGQNGKRGWSKLAMCDWEWLCCRKERRERPQGAFRCKCEESCTQTTDAPLLNTWDSILGTCESLKKPMPMNRGPLRLQIIVDRDGNHIPIIRLDERPGRLAVDTDGTADLDAVGGNCTFRNVEVVASCHTGSRR